MDVPTVDVATLRDTLEKGGPVTVLDVRDSEDRAEWSIPGSLHVDAYEALASGRPGPVADVALPSGQPVVAVCNRGNTSRLAAQVLRSRGFDARSLAGGMKAWSVAWNVAPVDDAVVQVRRTGKGCLSYVVVSLGEALVIDPSVEVGVYQRIARERGATIVRVLETHVHADHLSRARALAAATGATLHAPRTTRLRFPYEAVDEGGRVPVGNLVLTAMRTPGHTDESTCYLLGDRVFTGDTLFTSAVGRPDLETDRAGAERRARDLHASLARLLALPGTTRVLGAHASAPLAFDGVPEAATLDRVRSAVKVLALDADAFVSAVLKRLPEPPENAHTIVDINERGAPLPADPTDLEAGANRCAAGP